MLRLCISFYFITVSFGVFSEANDLQVSFYLDVERAYLEKDIAKFSEMLNDDYLMTVIVYVEEKLQTSRIQSKEEVLAALTESEVINNSGPSLVQNVQILPKGGGGGFCGQSRVETPADIKGESYSEIEVREICFSESDNGFKATEHRLGFIYRRVNAK